MVIAIETEKGVISSVDSNKKLLEKIEELRKEMILIGKQEGLTSSHSIMISKELDQLLNEYDKKRMPKKKIGINYLEEL
jgi:hypothetical protein